MDIRDGWLDKVVLVIHIFEDLEFLVFGGLDCIRVGRKSKVILAGSNTLLKITVFMFHSLVGNICQPNVSWVYFKICANTEYHRDIFE